MKRGRSHTLAQDELDYVIRWSTKEARGAKELDKSYVRTRLFASKSVKDVLGTTYKVNGCDHVYKAQDFRWDRENGWLLHAPPASQGETEIGKVNKIRDAEKSSIESEAEKKKDRSDLIERQIERLKCVVCQDVSCYKLQQCTNGHITCLLCFEKLSLQKCGLCRSNQFGQNLLAQDLMKDLIRSGDLLECSYATRGCIHVFINGEHKAEHVDCCQFRDRPCGLCEDKTCSFCKTHLGDIVKHWIREHKAMTPSEGNGPPTDEGGNRIVKVIPKALTQQRLIQFSECKTVREQIHLVQSWVISTDHKGPILMHTTLIFAANDPVQQTNRQASNVARGLRPVATKVRFISPFRPVKLGVHFNLSSKDAFWRCHYMESVIGIYEIGDEVQIKGIPHEIECTVYNDQTFNEQEASTEWTVTW